MFVVMIFSLFFSADKHIKMESANCFVNDMNNE